MKTKRSTIIVDKPDFIAYKQLCCSLYPYSPTHNGWWTMNLGYKELYTLDKLDHVLAEDAIIEGTVSFLTTDTYPATKKVYLSESTKTQTLEGWIDLSNAVVGEPVDIEILVSIVTPVSYKIYLKETYDGAPIEPMAFIPQIKAKYGIKIQMKMASAPAADRTFNYQIFRSVV